MGFTTNPGMVRVDRFKESGKWYDTLEIDMTEFYNVSSIQHAVLEAINVQCREWAATDFFAERWMEQGGFFVCLEPYHVHSHPVMLRR